MWHFFNFWHNNGNKKRKYCLQPFVYTSVKQDMTKCSKRVPGDSEQIICFKEWQFVCVHLICFLGMRLILQGPWFDPDLRWLSERSFCAHSPHVCVGSSGFCGFLLSPIYNRIGYDMCVHGTLRSRVYYCLMPDVPGIGFGSTVTMVRINWLQKASFFCKAFNYYM